MLMNYSNTRSEVLWQWQKETFLQGRLKASLLSLQSQALGVWSGSHSSAGCHPGDSI